MNTSGYLDIVPSPEGYNHIALFSPANSSKPRFLTSGEWEVSSGIKGIGTKQGVAYVVPTRLKWSINIHLPQSYFEAANPSSIERHLFSVQIPTTSFSDIVAPTQLTLTQSEGTPLPAFYDSNFSPEAGFYLLSYQGPDIPWQKVIQTNNTGRSNPNHLLQGNKFL